MSGRTARWRVLSWVVTALLLVALATAVGAAWWFWSPRAAMAVVDGVPTSAGMDDVTAVGDALFAALAAGGGLVSGVAVAVRPGRAPVSRAAVVVVGGAVAAVGAWRLGVWLGPPPLDAQQAAGLDPLVSPVALSSPAPLVMWPATCTAAIFVGLIVSLLVRPPEHPPLDPPTQAHSVPV